MPYRCSRARQVPLRVKWLKMSKVARMVRSVQRLGGGLESVTAISWRASSPGPRRSRSRIGSGSSKIPPARAALGMGDQSRRPLGLVAIQPCIHGIRVAWLQEPPGGHVMGGLAVSDLEDGGPSFPNIGSSVM